MFARLFAQSGLSLDRLRALVEVGARGGIVRAAEGDPARQSQFSRQIKELEDFFHIALVERHGKGVRLTAQGKELARISRFFLLGLSSFQRGCLAEGQTYRIGASATVLGTFLLPLLARLGAGTPDVRFRVETVNDTDAERRLHDLTLDFAIVTRSVLSRPLQTKELGRFRLRLWVPRSLCRNAQQAARAFTAGQLPLVWPAVELPLERFDALRDHEPAVTCGSFLEARAVIAEQTLSAVLPDFLQADPAAKRLLQIRAPAVDEARYEYHLAWNPRLLRLNPHAARRRDTLARLLSEEFTKSR
jgi:DNA-binding transcriptional LysR family regulator